jgi:transposase
MRRRRESNRRIRRIMLIALARKLAIALWRYVETSVVPEGVIMASNAG